MADSGRPIKNKPGWQAGLILFLSVLGIFILSGILLVYFGDRSLYRIEIILNVAIYTSLMLVVRYLMKRYAYSFKAIFGAVSLKGVPWFQFGALGLLFIVYGISFLAAFLRLRTYLDPNLFEEIFTTPPETQSLLVVVLFPVTVVPVVEEILFRGILLNRLGRRRSAKYALFVSSLIFSLLHLNGVFVPQFLAGLLFGMSYIQTRKLLVPILLHMLYNALVLFPTFGAETSAAPLSVQVAELEQFLSWGTAVFLCLTPICIYLGYKYSKKLSNHVPLYSEESKNP